MLSLAKISAILFAIGFAFCQYLIYVYAPLEQTMGLAQKIFYYHLPVAWWCFVAFFVNCVCSIAYLKTRKKKYDYIASSAAEIGLLLASLAILTGMIWGKNSWNVWWTWDPRLTTTLVLWFIYVGYLIIHSMPTPRAPLVSAVVGIIGFADVPLVFFSARLWRSIHPNVFANESGGLEPEMAHAVIACVLVFFFLFLALLILRTRQKAQEEYIEETINKDLFDEHHAREYHN